jgi:hydroxyethylthiazole kinase-like uncharacterized protein yjeF
MYSVKTPIYQSLQIRDFERLAQDNYAIAGAELMQRAGKAAFDFLQRRWPQAQKLAVFCGSGNNGGDGYVLAQIAQERGLKVSIWQVGDHHSLAGEAKNAMEACQKAGIPIEALNETADLQHPEVVVDAICGIGLNGSLREDIITAIEKITRLQVPIFSIDVPTGLNADTGHVLGTAIRAAATITFIGLKLGLLTGSGPAYTGELILNDLHLPAELFAGVEPVAEKIQLNTFASYLKPRSRDWHKGLSGHVLIVGGDEGYFGAAIMAAEAALRVGAGLVSVATRPQNAHILNAEFPEIMCHGVTNIQDLEPLLTKADVIVIGPGLGQSDWAVMLWDYVSTQTLPMVVDADGLNLLAKTLKVSEHWVLTPHPGEAARLLSETPEIIQQDRLNAVKAISKRYGGVCVLKGSGSLISSPKSQPVLCDKGNPGMATGGMGDVLSGVIGGLMAQGIPLGDAAKLGVCMHATAGDLAAKEGERGMIATDLLPYLRRLANHSTQS